MRPRKLFAYALAGAGLLWATQAAALTDKELLGRHLYMDTSLSKYQNQSCMTCHHPMAGWTDPANTFDPYNSVVSTGSDGASLGGRQAPSAAYAAFSPTFHWDATAGMFIGGQFWDGRAPTLVEQAKGPFLNPAEMAMPSKAAVVKAVQNSSYAWLFLQVYGRNAFRNVDKAYDNIADAIAAFEKTPHLNRFSSKYDAYLAGQVALTAQEARGMELFEDPLKGNCAACHPSGAGAVFTDFSYDNLGIPKSTNPQIAQNATDYGLGAFVGDPQQNGKFKVPTLRNAAITPPYGHNGYFATLREIVSFYNTRDVADWPPPEVPENVNVDELGDLGLSPEEVDAIVAFLGTLTDAHMGGGGPGGGGMGGVGMGPGGPRGR
jgi:cytochrome c peroxidase